MKILETKKAVKIIFLAIAFLGGLFFCSSAQAATAIYRSVGPGSTNALASGTSNALTISGSTASFASGLPNSIGVGDALQYDADGDDDIDASDSIIFIHSRTDATHYTVKTASGSAPAAVSSETDWSIFRAYTSLADAEAGTENSGIDADLVDFDSWTGGKDLVSADQQWNIACYGDAEDTTVGVVIQGWTTDADNYLKIYTPYLSSEVGVSQRHSGVWSETKYRLVVSDDFPEGPPLAINTGSDVNSANVWIDGLQIFTNSAIMNSYGIEAYNVTGETKISNSIIKCDLALSSNWGLYIHNLTHTGTYKVWNNIFYGFFDGGIYLSGSENTLYAYSNTVVGGSAADVCYSRSSGTYVAKNNIAQSCATGFSGTFDGNSDYNLSDLDDAPGTNAVNSASVTFAGAEDYRLDSLDVSALDHGTDLSADGNIAFSSDIENQARGVSWDIGADEYAMADSTGPTLTEVTPVSTPTNDATPNYVFSSTEVGNIAYGGDCSSSTNLAVSGNNTITFSALASGPHSNCTIIVTDAAGNPSNTLGVLGFTIDLVAPTLSGGSPTGALAYNTTQVDISAQTNEAAACRYDVFSGTSYASMTNFSTTGTTVHSKTITGLSSGNTYHYYVKCEDDAGNINSSDYEITFSVSTPPDSSAPTRSNGSPSGILAASTTQVTAALTTDENATCKYATSSGVAYGSMPGSFTTTGEMAHSTVIAGLSAGNTYNYYVRCQDSLENPNSDDFLISFVVQANPVSTTSNSSSSHHSKKKKKTKRTVKQSPSSIPQGGILVQSGTKFTKNGNVALYFSKAGGGYYPPKIVKANKAGSFSISARIFKPKGTYPWYAVDLATGKKSKNKTYQVR